MVGVRRKVDYGKFERICTGGVCEDKNSEQMHRLERPAVTEASLKIAPSLARLNGYWLVTCLGCGQTYKIPDEEIPEYLKDKYLGMVKNGKA